MHHRLCVVIYLVLAGCGGSLTDEQRKEMRERMEENQIVRVTEVEITEAAYAEGRRIIKTLDSLSAHPARLDSFLGSESTTIRFITKDAAGAWPLEKQLLQAYLADSSGLLQDNVQKVRNADGGFDSLLYTKPETQKGFDGKQILKGVWNVWLPKKDLVIAISSTK